MTPGRAKYYDKYEYTSRRWLHNSDWNRDTRYQYFNFDALCQRVLDAVPGSSAIVRFKKREGSSNRAFVMYTDNNKVVLAKLPLSCGGPVSLLTHSEVATMKYLRMRTDIPIPRVIDWCDFPDNEVGSEFIIMEHSPGIPLSLKWPTMNRNEKIRLVEYFYELIKQVFKLKFPSHGSLYFAHLPLPGNRATLPFTGGFRIGPHCGDRFWGLSDPEPRYYSRVDPDRGPWPGLEEYCDGLINTGISRIPTSEAQLEVSPRPWYYGPIDDHLEVLDTAREVMRKIPMHEHFRRPMLVYPDFHLGNIFVSRDDPCLITAIIDWQKTSIEPAFVQIRRLPFLKIDTLDNDSQACFDRLKADLEIGHPRLYQALNFDDDVFRLYQHCCTTWLDGTTILHSILANISARWREMLLPLEESPFPAKTEEQIAYLELNRWGFNEACALKAIVAEILGTRIRDGIVSPGDYEEKKHENIRLFRAFLYFILWRQAQGLISPFQNEYQLRLVWPFDL